MNFTIANKDKYTLVSTNVGVNGSLVICSLQEPVMKLVQISQLESVLSITPTVEEAVDLLYMEEIEKDVKKED